MKDLSQYTDAELEAIANSASYSDADLERIAGTGKRTASDEIKAKHAKNVSAEAADYKPSWTESFETGYKQGGPSGMGAAMGVANVVGEGLKGVGDAIVGAPETIKGMYEGAKGFVDPANYKSIAENPIVDLPGNIGKSLLTASEALISPRTTGKLATEVLAPGAIVKGAKVATQVSKAGAAAGARRLVSSVVKPSLKDQAFTKDPTGAILKHRVIGNSEKSMLGNVDEVVTKLNDDVGANVAKSGAQVSPAEVNGILDNIIARISSDVGETNAPGIISKLQGIQERVMSRYGDRNLNLQEVHTLRREIDDGISFTEDAVEKGVNKGKYEFRTGLNNIIEKHVPGVKATNMDIASLLSAKEALTRRVNTAQNSNFFTPLTVAGEIGTTLAGAPGAYLGTKLATKALGSTAVKSRAAQALETMSGRRQPVRPIEPPPPAPPIPQGPTPQDLLQNAGGNIRYSPGPRPISGGSGNALSPQEPVRGSWFEENASNLQPEVREASRVQAAQGPTRPLPPELENMTFGQYMRLTGKDPLEALEKAKAFDENFLRTTEGR